MNRIITWLRSLPRLAMAGLAAQSAAHTISVLTATARSAARIAPRVRSPRPPECRAPDRQHRPGFSHEPWAGQVRALDAML